MQPSYGASGAARLACDGSEASEQGGVAHGPVTGECGCRKAPEPTRSESRKQSSAKHRTVGRQVRTLDSGAGEHRSGGSAARSVCGASKAALAAARSSSNLVVREGPHPPSMLTLTVASVAEDH